MMCNASGGNYKNDNDREKWIWYKLSVNKEIHVPNL